MEGKSMRMRAIMVCILGAAFMAAAAAIYVYWAQFHLSPKPEMLAWSQFGGYLGGVLGPTFSLLALIAVLLSLQSMSDQLDVARRAAEAQVFLDAVDRLQAEHVRDSRGVVFRLSIDQKKPFDEWTADERRIAQVSCQAFDVVGMMIRGKMMQPLPFIREWRSTIQKTWLGTADLIKARRVVDGDDLWDDFEWLYKESKQYGVWSPPPTPGNAQTRV